MPQRNRRGLPMPFKGFVDVPSFRDTELDTTLDALNVVPWDPVTGRRRISKRPGTNRAINDPVSSAGNPVQRMRQITLSAGAYTGGLTLPGTNPGETDETGNWGFDDPEFVEPIEYDASTDLSQDAITATSADLSISEATGGVPPYTYTLQRASSPFSDIKTVTPPTFSDTGLTPDSDYTYRVQVEDQRGETALSNEVDVTTNMEAGTLSSTDTSTDSITVQYDSFTEGDYSPYTHTLQRDDGDGDGFQDVTTLTVGTPYEDEGLDSDTSYDYRVVSSNNENDTVNSNTVTESTDSTVLLDEDFDYSGGELGAVSGGTWDSKEHTGGSVTDLPDGDRQITVESSDIWADDGMSGDSAQMKAFVHHPNTIGLDTSSDFSVVLNGEMDVPQPSAGSFTRGVEARVSISLSSPTAVSESPDCELVINRQTDTDGSILLDESKARLDTGDDGSSTKETGITIPSSFKLELRVIGLTFEVYLDDTLVLSDTSDGSHDPINRPIFKLYWDFTGYDVGGGESTPDPSTHARIDRVRVYQPLP